MNKENNIILYQDDNEITRVSVRFADEDLWLTQNQLADIYCTTQQNISQHVDNIYKDGVLTIEATNKKFLLVRQEGNRQFMRSLDFPSVIINADADDMHMCIVDIAMFVHDEQSLSVPHFIHIGISCPFLSHLSSPSV